MIEPLLQIQWPLEQVWSTPIGFVTIMIMIVGMVGIISKSMSIPSYGGYMTFVYYAIETDIAILETVLFPTLTLVIIGVVFKLWRLEAVGNEV